MTCNAGERVKKINDAVVHLLSELQASTAGGASASTTSMNLSSVLDNAVSSAVDMLTSFQVINHTIWISSKITQTFGEMLKC